MNLYNIPAKSREAEFCRRHGKHCVVYASRDCTLPVNAKQSHRMHLQSQLVFSTVGFFLNHKTFARVATVFCNVLFVAMFTVAIPCWAFSHTLKEMEKEGEKQHLSFGLERYLSPL